jgi:hypothetical protein
VSPKDIESAKKDADKHPLGAIKSLPFTESNYEWVLLYKHIRVGQITPWAMRNMRRKDLYYLAGLTFPHPALAQPDDPKYVMFQIGERESVRWEQLTKIQGNAIRAQVELRYRNFFWATTCVVLAALLGSFVAWILPTLIKVS